MGQINNTNMKKQTIIAKTVALLLLGMVSLPAAAQTTTLAARAGSKMRIEGTSNIHDWQVESPFIGGFLEVGPNFPMEPGQAVTPGKVEVKGDVFIQVRSLKSLEKDGKPYSDKMDEVMWEHMKETEYKRIVFHPTELTLKEAPKTKDAPFVFDAQGELAVAGVTNKLAMVVSVVPLGDNKLKVTGTTNLKMTSFKIDPPAPKIALGMIKTGDDVKLIFEWMLAPRKAPGAAAK
jgi:hypothetical protein